MIGKYELRLNSCVKYKDTIWRVVELRHDSAWLRNLDDYCTSAKYKNLQPIEIGDAYLSDCGYEEVNKGLWFDYLRNARFFIKDCVDHFNLQVYNMTNNPNGIKICDAKIKYIHTLQMLVEMYQSIIDNESKQFNN